MGFIFCWRIGFIFCGTCKYPLLLPIRIQMSDPGPMDPLVFVFLRFLNG